MNEPKAKIATTKEFLALPKDERKKALQEGRFVTPARGTPERTEFDSKVFKDPEPAPSAPPAQAAPAAAAQAKEPEKPAPKPAEAPPVAATPPPSPAPASAPSSAPAPVKAPVADFLGYKTPEEAKKAFDDMKALAAKQADLIAKLNSTATNLGRERAELQRQYDAVSVELKTKREAAAENAAPVDVVLPEPIDPEKYVEEGGVVSEKYQKALAAYNREMAKTMKTVIERNKTLEKDLSEIKPKLETSEKHFTESKVAAEQNARTEAFNKMNNTASELQKNLGLATTVTWTTINDNVALLHDEKADPTVRKQAQEFINSLSPEDVGNFNKLRQAVNLAFDFSTGLPQVRFDLNSKQFKGALEDMGLTVKTEQPPAPSVDLERLHQQQTAQGVTGIPPQQVGGDENLSAQAPLTTQEKKERLAELNRMRQADPAAFQADTKKWQEYKDLRVQFGVPVPA
jgi:hypothetical protein